MKFNYKILLPSFFIAIMISAFLIPNLYNPPVTIEPTKDIQGNYQYRIEARQWRYTAYDLVHAASLMEELGVTNLTTGLNSGEFISIQQSGYIGSFYPGALITITLYSRDVQHGFSIDELNVKQTAIRPGIGQVWGPPTNFSFTFPNKDTILKAYTHIFSGLGTDDMILRFFVGDKKFNFSYLNIETVYWLGSIYLMVIIILIQRRNSIKIENNVSKLELYPKVEND